ncbi:MAG: A/G-specific adenine glycosylase, partial [Bacteroidota bacterium]
MNKQFFTKQLLRWSETIDRPMPWKGEKNPYLIWLSEIILQQTRVEQGLPYFLKFKANYPTVHDLANAPEDEVMKLWEGLGYYSRARNLHFTAKFISKELNGIFPKNYDSILKLKGVGAYTAAAIASFAYDLPHAVVDGNVYRVLSRFFGIKTPIDTTEGKKQFTQLANELLVSDQAAKYNQAIMDFGAIQCMPKNPLCHECTFQTTCKAFQQKKI